MENTIIINKCGEEIYIDKETKKVVCVVRNGRKYKADRYINNPYYCGIAEEYFAETGKADEEETCDLQDVVVNINESQIGRVVGMKDGKYRIVMSTGKLVELNRNEFYLDSEEPLPQAEEIPTIKVGYYNYEVFENEYVIRFSCNVLDRVFVYNKKFKDFKLMQISTNKVLSAKRYYTNYYNIMSQLQDYVNKGA